MSAGAGLMVVTFKDSTSSCASRRFKCISNAVAEETQAEKKPSAEWERSLVQIQGQDSAPTPPPQSTSKDF